MSNEQDITQDKMFQQLAIIKSRLEGFPFANHEAVMLRDCLLGLIRTIVGDDLPVTLGGGAIAGHFQDGQNGEVMSVAGRAYTGGAEIAPGVMMYPPQNPAPVGGHQSPQLQQHQQHYPPNHQVPQQPPVAQQPALIDVEAGMAALGQVMGAPAPGLPQPLPGSLMDQALRGEQAGAPVPESPTEPAPQPLPGVPPPGVPTPSQTQVVITGPGESKGEDE